MILTARMSPSPGAAPPLPLLLLPPAREGSRSWPAGAEAAPSTADDDELLGRCALASGGTRIAGSGGSARDTERSASADPRSANSTAPSTPTAVCTEATDERRRGTAIRKGRPDPIASPPRSPVGGGPRAGVAAALCAASSPKGDVSGRSGFCKCSFGSSGIDCVAAEDEGGP